MRTIKTTVYLYDELSPDAQQKAREWFGRSPDYPSLEDTRDEWPAEVLPALGFSDPSISYSGCCSQGDGALFTGTWYARKCAPAAMLANRPQDTELHTLAERLLKIASAHREMFAKLSHTGHY